MSKNRFVKKKRDWALLKDLLLPVLLFAAVQILFFRGVDSVGSTAGDEQLRSVEAAISRATVQCYAIEGAYPSSLGYLEDNYGLYLDRDRYIIQYEPIGSNIMPRILVLPMNFEGSEDMVIPDDGGLF